MPRIVIVGAGPAGMAAAAVLVEHGLRPVVLNENTEPGGQAWRRATAPIAPDMKLLLGSELPKFERAHAAFAAAAPRIDYRPNTLAWNVFDGEVFAQSDRRGAALRYDALILATGATDRMLPVPGWTLPGVYTLGAAQTLLKDQGATIGRRVAFVGASPLLYLAALQHHALGVNVAAVLDTTGAVAKARAVLALAGSDAHTFLRGLGYMARLWRGGVPMHLGATDFFIEGEERVTGLRIRSASGREQRVECDAVALGFGLRSEIQLAELAGSALRFDPVFRQWLPEADIDGRAGGGLYVAGDGATIGGADAAELSGRLAAFAVLQDAGKPVPEAERASLRASLARLRRFQRALAGAFAWPAHWLAAIPDDTPLCRCEGVTIGAMRDAVARPLGPAEVNRAKAITRCGMGRCQSRFCGLATAEVVAAGRGVPVERIGRLRVQAPVKPIPLTTVLEEAAP